MKRPYLNLSAILLLLAMLIAAFSGCAGSGVESGTTAGTTAAANPDSGEEQTPEVTAVLPDIPDTMWNREFRVLGCGDKTSISYPSFEIYAEDYTGEAMNDSVFARNETLRKKYGITVSQTLIDKTHDRISKNQSTGTDEFDLVFTFAYKVGALAQKGYFYDMHKVNYIDFSKPWWSKVENDALSIKGHIYYTGSDYSLRDKNRVQVIVCNDALIEDKGLAPVPGLVRSGDWTAEKMAEYVNACADELDGDGRHTKADMFGLALSSYDCFAALCFGCGVHLIDKDGSDGLVVVSDLDHDAAAVDAVLNIFRPETSMSPEDYGRDWDIASDTFEDGRALFTINSIQYVSYYNQVCPFDYTVLPCPMLDKDQDAYYSMAEVRCMLFSIPVTNPDPDFAGFALEAFSYESTNTTKTTFIELYCKTRNVRNADSVDMLNIVLDTVVYDNSIIYSETIPLYGILNSYVPVAKSNVFLRYMSSFKSKTQKEIDKINSDHAG